MIRIGDRVRAKVFKERKNSRELICSHVGIVEVISEGQAMVRVPGAVRLIRVMVRDLERIT